MDSMPRRGRQIGYFLAFTLMRPLQRASHSLHGVYAPNMH
jgi:hypothetical protein